VHSLFYPIPPGQVVHNRQLALRKKYPTKLGIICERYWLLNLVPKFGQHMESPPKHKQCQPNKTSNMLKVWGFYILFWPTWWWASPYTNRYLPST
jgi:hypothetical protein